MHDNKEIVIIIPTYNNDKTIANIIDRIKKYSNNIIVVNDGSTDNTSNILSSIPDINVISYKQNKGKGNAIKVGLKHAYDLGYVYAITIDSDGQHYPEDIPVFISEIKKHPDSIIIGARNLKADNMPSKNTFANKFSNFWFWAETGHHLDDTQSGFRLYPLKKIKKLNLFCSGYAFEVEIIVKAAWKFINVLNVPINVYYPPETERVTHFKPLKDFTKISLLNTYLIILALLFFHPYRLVKCLSWKKIKIFIKNDIYNSKDNNLHISLSVGLGIFMGIVPLWGYQMIICIFLAHIFHLSKTISIVCSNISIPPIMPFILLGSYQIGCVILNQPMSLTIENISFDNILINIGVYIIGSFALAFMAGLFSFLITWFLLSVFRLKNND